MKKSDTDNFNSGKKYGYFLLTGKSFRGLIEKNQTRTYQEVVCDCGKILWVLRCNLKSELTKSCGCKTGKIISDSKIQHGCSIRKNKHPLYNVWGKMKDRCYNEKRIAYKDYGGRGIKICNDWLNDFMSFYNWSISNGYKDGLQIDRIDNDGDYMPSNCRYADDITQARNKRSNRKEEAFGEIKLLIEWAEDKRCMVAYKTLHQRLNHCGWNLEKALVTKSRNIHQCQNKINAN